MEEISCDMPCMYMLEHFCTCKADGITTNSNTCPKWRSISLVFFSKGTK